jgi:uncharacterized protein
MDQGRGMIHATKQRFSSSIVDRPNALNRTECKHPSKITTTPLCTTLEFALFEVVYSVGWAIK